MSISKLKPSQLYTVCDPQKFDFASTVELEERMSALGQDRAISAVELGINIKSKGYNLFCLGPEGTGKTSLVKRILEEEAKKRPTPKDWAYVYNFDEPYKPHSISFPAGQAAEFAKDVDKLIDDFSVAIPAILESDEYKAGVSIIQEKYKQKKEEYLRILQKKAKGKSVSLLHMQVGLVVAPVKNGEVLSPEAFDELPEEEKKELINDLNLMQEEIEKAAKDLPEWEDKQRREHNVLREKFIKLAVKSPIDTLRQKYKGHREINDFLKNVQNHIVANIDDFLPVDAAPQQNGGEEDALSSLLSKMNRQEEDKFAKFKVNVIVKNEPESGAPIIHLDHPTQGNLVGRVERIQQYGALLTDFTLIKAGALHRANGGFLLIDARKLLIQPYAWDSLKRSLASKNIKIETPGDETSFTTISLDPEPIPLDVKIILTGDEELYELLSERDPDFSDYFKVEADFGTIMDRTDDNEIEYAKLIGSLSNKKKLRSLNRQAVARVIEYSSRLAEDSKKLTAHIASIGDLLREADYWARESNSKQIGKKHIDQAVSAQIYRSDRIKQAMLEQIDDGTILIDITGEKVGQINGLVVYNFSRFSFGKPARITVQARIGSGEFINIERETNMSGPIHTKGVLILQSLIANRFAKYSPLSLSASIVFEQSYGGVDGDSASSTEYYCLLSAIANLPIKQNIAVTGSINQFGDIQPIGGVNEKIEGFFDVCVHRGLTGDQGVIIPRTNVGNLMLREDVIAAVREGKFHIYAIDTVDDGIEILTGIKAGKPNAKGEFPKGSVNYLVKQSLDKFYQLHAAYAKETFGSVVC
uniref:endopeptidase La n=1 Tax=uncultured Alphaproteobacteria bacterium TaxID=91750 RepID=A0A6M4NP74_9PROT|nr:ATP-dependent protease [uncultured Alphaproteobacteria bacterium]